MFISVNAALIACKSMLGINEHHEVKYLISEEKAFRLREFIRSYLDLSEYSVIEPSASYAVHNLYLDADDLQLYTAFTTGYRNRYALRVRYYAASMTAPIRFQIKRWTNECVITESASVKLEATIPLLQGIIPKPDQMMSFSAKALKTLEIFACLSEQLSATPKVHVVYQREEYVNETEQVSLNLDRHIKAEPQGDVHLQSRSNLSNDCYGDKVMLELKFCERYPNWFEELVSHFNLEEYDTTKYAAAIQAAGLAPA